MITRRALLESIAIAAAAPMTGCTAPLRSTRRDADLLATITDQVLTAYPESASSAGVDVGRYTMLKFRLTDRSPEGQAAIEANVRAALKRLNAVDTRALPADEALNIEVVRTVYETAAAGFDFPYGDVAGLNSNWSYRNTPYVVAQNVGAFVEIPQFLSSAHQISTRDDAEAYLERIQGYAKQLDGEAARITRDGARGVVLPDFLMAKALNQMSGQLAKDPAQWGIVTTLAERAQKLGAGYAERAVKLAQSELAPALERQIAALSALKPRESQRAGAWALPDGEAYYAWALKAGTTTELSPDEVHEMGLEELDALHGRMDPILRDVGYSSGSVGERMIALARDPRFQFSEGDEGRREILAFIADRLQDIRARMPQAVETLVPGFLEVTRIPQEVEAGAPGAYGGPGSIDGKQPGHFWINLRTPALHSKFSLPDLTYHEAIPGHVWQGEYTFKQPLIRSLLAFNAYSEGWALYAEQLADELGVYEDFPVGRLGYLQSLAFRACRLAGVRLQGRTHRHRAAPGARSSSAGAGVRSPPLQRCGSSRGQRADDRPRPSYRRLRCARARLSDRFGLEVGRFGTDPTFALSPRAARVMAMIVVTNRIPVSKGHEIDFEDRFKRRAHLVDQSPGFVRNEVHRPKPMRMDRESGTWVPDDEGQGYYEVKTWWRSFEDFVAWTKSDSFKEAHKDRPPAEMFAGPNVLEIHEVFTSTDLELGGGTPD